MKLTKTMLKELGFQCWEENTWFNKEYDVTFYKGPKTLGVAVRRLLRAAEVKGGRDRARKILEASRID